MRRPTMMVRTQYGNGWAETPVFYAIGQWRVTRPLAIGNGRMGPARTDYVVTHAPSTRRASERIRTLAAAKHFCQLLHERFPKFRSVGQLNPAHKKIWSEIHREVMESGGRT